MKTAVKTNQLCILAKRWDTKEIVLALRIMEEGQIILNLEPKLRSYYAMKKAIF